MPRHEVPWSDHADAEAEHGEGSTPLRARTNSVLDSASELLPRDLQQDYYELRNKPGMSIMRASFWLLFALLFALAVLALPWVAYRLYGFDKRELRCEGEVAGKSRHAIETAIGAAPIQLRSILIGFAVVQLCRKVTGARGDGLSLGRALLTMPSADGDAQVVSNAGWEAIVGRGINATDGPHQPSWAQARDARKLTQQQAVSSGVVKLLFWHWSQPVVFLWMLVAYRCVIASLGDEQCWYASVIAAREMLYLASTIAATWCCPVFLLMDPITAWQEAPGYLERARRAAMWVLAPHNYTALCLSNRFRRQWSFVFMGLATIQMAADISSCVALAALIQDAIKGQKADQVTLDTPTAIIIGYVTTASGFVMFFGPMSVIASFKETAEKKRHSCSRAALAILGTTLLCALCYIVFLYVMLIGGWFNPWCDGFTFAKHPCNGHGTCFGAGQCKCDYSYGPDHRYDLGPNGMQLNEQLCTQRMPCSGWQLQRADRNLDQHACGGVHFPRSRLLTADMGTTLMVLANHTRVDWQLCFSSFQDDASSPTAFHKQCDMYNTTMVVVRNSLGFTFGGYAEGSWNLERCCAYLGNSCTMSNLCLDRVSANDFLFRLAPGHPEIFLPSGSDTIYQQVGPDEWPAFGHGADLYTGGSHAPGGIYGHCHHMTYVATDAEVCGGFGNWGSTDIEVWHLTSPRPT